MIWLALNPTKYWSHSRQSVLLKPCHLFPWYFLPTEDSWGGLEGFLYINDIFKWSHLILTGLSSKYMGYNFLSTVAHQRFSIPFALKEVNFDHLLPIKWSITASPLPNNYRSHGSLGTWPVEMAQVSPHSQLLRPSSATCILKLYYTSLIETPSSLRTGTLDLVFIQLTFPFSPLRVPFWSYCFPFCEILMLKIFTQGNIISVQPFSWGLCVTLLLSLFGGLPPDLHIVF